MDELRMKSHNHRSDKITDGLIIINPGFGAINTKQKWLPCFSVLRMAIGRGCPTDDKNKFLLGKKINSFEHFDSIMIFE